MNKAPHRIPILDINQSAFHLLHGDNPQEELQPGGRVAFMHELGDTFYDLAGDTTLTSLFQYRTT